MTSQPKTATFIRQLGQAEKCAHDARLYKLSEPAPLREFGRKAPTERSPKTEYVVVSSKMINRSGHPETKVFRSDERGITEWTQMITQAVVPGEGQFEEALRAFGYQLISEING